MLQPCEPPGIAAQKQPTIGFEPAAAGFCNMPCYWHGVRKVMNDALGAEKAKSSRKWHRFFENYWELPCCRSETGAQHLAEIPYSAPSRPPAARGTSRSVDRADAESIQSVPRQNTDIGTTSQGGNLWAKNKYHDLLPQQVLEHDLILRLTGHRAG